MKARVLEGAALAGTLALAALLRLGWPGVNLWDFDQALVSLLSLRMARQGMPSSTGLPNFPATIWIFALPYSISTDLLVASLFVGVLGMLAVLGVWWLARRAWGPWAASAAALLFAASPFAVVYSRDIWSQELLPPLAVLWAMTGLIGVTQQKAWAVAPGDYHQFNHLRSAQDPNPIGIQDVPASSQAWQVGDALITWAEFERPAQSGPFYLHVGMYTWPELERASMLDRPGDPLAPSLSDRLNSRIHEAPSSSNVASY